MCDACWDREEQRAYVEPTPNLPLLRKVRDQIDADPKSWNQQSWFEIDLSSAEITVTLDKGFDQKLQGVENCKTAACVAGWTVMLGGDEQDQPYVANREIINRLQYMERYPDAVEACTASCKSGETIAERAQELLGLTPEEAGNLFKSENDRDDLEYWFKEIAARAGEEL